jgi:hypothetical protein
MAAEAEEEVSGLALLKQPATLALANFLNDLLAMISFQAYLWEMIVRVDYGHGDPSKFAAPGAPAPPESAVGQMDTHSQVLEEMIFCRRVNSFQTYLTELLTLIFEAKPEALKSQKQVTREFCVEHHAANDLISALAEQTVNELAYQGLKDLAKFFSKKLQLPLFTKDEHLENAALCVDIRNIITHNRGIVNGLFAQRHPAYANAVGHRVTLTEKDIREMTGTLGYCLRRLDIRAVKKFGLPTIEPQFRDPDESPSLKQSGS